MSQVTLVTEEANRVELLSDADVIHEVTQPHLWHNGL
jgi:hypothetical protein